ncbi:MAG TPA: glycosyltransferase family 2 protein [Nitriliruptorales bacterium]|nr:glycosyltransferase family 2 protein [Nitriliruptorales bacterium]
MSDRHQPVRPDATDVTVVLPAYNEAGHIRAEVERISAALKDSPYSFEILVVDDGSTDGTADLVEGMPFVTVKRFPTNRGSGTARRVGTAEAHGRWVVWTDADMTYPNERIPEFIDVLRRGGAEQVVGARTSEQGTLKPLRVPAKWAIRRLAEFLTSATIPDLNSGLRAFSKETAKPYLGLLPAGFSCVTTITLAFLANGHLVEYVPIDYHPRAGRSHFHPLKDAYRYILQVVRMVTFFEPLRVFAPIALALMGFGGIKFIYDLIVHPFRVATNTVLLILTGLILFSFGLLADLVVRTNRSE